MGRMQRNKGASFEREVAGDLREKLGVACTRRLGQARDGGHDLHLAGMVPECKRRASFIAHGWMRQAEIAAKGTSDLPVVFARADGEKTLVIMRLDDWCKVAREHIADAVLAHVQRQDTPATMSGDADQQEPKSAARSET